MRVNITSNKIPSNKIPSSKVSRSLPSDMTHWKHSISVVFLVVEGAVRSGVQNVPPESNNWETLAKSKLKDILQNNWPGLYKRVKIVTKQRQTKKLFWIEADDGNTEANDFPGSSDSLPTMWETWVQSLGREGLLEKEMTTHSRILAWKIPWTEEPGRLQSMGLQRVGHNWATSLHNTMRNPKTDARPRKRHPWDSWENLKKVYKLVSVISRC